MVKAAPPRISLFIADGLRAGGGGVCGWFMVFFSEAWNSAHSPLGIRLCIQGDLYYRSHGRNSPDNHESPLKFQGSFVLLWRCLLHYICCSILRNTARKRRVFPRYLTSRHVRKRRLDLASVAKWVATPGLGFVILCFVRCMCFWSGYLAHF